MRVVFVACGWGHTVALTSDGGVIAFGGNGAFLCYVFWLSK